MFPPPACPGPAARRESSLIAPRTLPSRPAAPPAVDRTNRPAAPAMERPVANQQKRLKIKTSAQTGGKEVGEMTIEVLQQQEQADTLSCGSLDRADPHYLNLKSNFHLSEEDSESNGSVDEFKTVGPKKRAEGRSRRESIRDGEATGAGVETEGVGRLWHTPTCHRARASRKLQDWKIRVNKPVAFLGDSNLNRIPPFNNDQIQVESYPGANFYHFFHLLDTAPVCEETGVVVLSIGLNNKDQDRQKTSIKQLRRVVHGAQTAFPNADIFVAHIHFSKSLSKIQQYNLTMINHFISTHYKYLPCISQQYFHTIADGIHWTRETAGRIFGSWCENLHLNAGLEE